MAECASCFCFLDKLFEDMLPLFSVDLRIKSEDDKGAVFSPIESDTVLSCPMSEDDKRVVFPPPTESDKVFSCSIENDKFLSCPVSEDDKRVVFPTPTENDKVFSCSMPKDDRRVVFSCSTPKDGRG